MTNQNQNRRKEMSLEPGGRADKYGNQYENQYLVRLLLRVVAGKYKSIVVEALGENKDSVEYIATDMNDNVIYYQCKASNATRQHWTLYDLNSHNVFNRSKEIIEKSPKNKYYFVSPLNYGELSELCKRAGTNSSVDEFLNYQLNNSNIRTLFNDCAKYYGLDSKDKQQCSTLLNILSKCYFETSFSGTENIMDLNEFVGMYFSGNAGAARLVLENYINSNGLFGIKITANDIISFMNKNGFMLRSNLHTDNLLVKINELNNIFCNVFQPIKNTIIHRKETEEVISNIKSGKSIILHGNAGVGKSGCVQEVIDTLKSNNILFLALKLDKHIPQISSDNYGNELGLQQSPVYCLHSLSAGTPCVLILDQLDSLRWTNQHSTSALEICKELISQVNLLNKEENGHISILFISRTFDLENDAGLRTLFASKEKEPSSWNKIQISTLSREDVQNILGSEYNNLSAKLQHLLLTPSSLYIWTQLNNHVTAQASTTPFDLMEKWWQQIQSYCTALHLDVNRVTAVKNSIVKRMENSSVLALPEQLYADSGIELNALISNGLLIKTGNKISFTHQSFLDYFAVSDMLTEIYDGKNILEVIGDANEQTPTLRYRILRILQNILTSSEDLFITISEQILTSSNVRHYFKCTVFEVIGQYENPTELLFEYVYRYYNDNEWCEYVYNTVYLGHSQYVLDLDNHGSFDWLNDKGLGLLRSINYQIPNFVVSKISPICFKSKEDDKLAYTILCYDCSKDDSSMFELRLKLLEANPELLKNYWSMHTLIDNDSQNLIPILKLILKLNEELNGKMYLEEEKNITLYSKKHYNVLIEELLPEACNQTEKYNLQDPVIVFDENYRKWIEKEHDNHVVRQIINMLKTCMCELSHIEPERFISFITDYNDKRSVIYYEIIANAIINLDEKYSDFAISWLCENPLTHFFIYTGNQRDYLFITKKIITKFSSLCSIPILNNLEAIIVNWKEPTEKMVEKYKQRVETNRKETWAPVYYTYWGHLQKELLPCIDQTRITGKAQKLISVLNRNKWIKTPFYNSGFWVSPVKSVVSPINEKTKLLTDKKWLEIISTPNEKFKRSFSGKETDSYYVESNHWSFASSLSSQATLEPSRFAKLSLKFPLDCSAGYITSVINSLCNHDESVNKVDFSLVCDVIMRYKIHKDINVIMSILRLIEKRADENWPKEILDFVCEMAINSPDPEIEQYTIRSKDKKVNETPHSLSTTAINSVRGSAMKTISAILWKHYELGEKFKPIVQEACNDVHDAVRFSVTSCIFPYYNIDKDFCLDILKTLVQKDIRVLGYYHIWEIIGRTYRTNNKFYTTNLLKACDSNIDELNNHAAGLLCAIAIIFDNNLISELFSRDLSEKQVNAICHEAVSFFNDDEYHHISQEILLHYIDKADHEITSFGSLFFNRCINIDRDEVFLLRLIKSKQKPHQLYQFLKYINNQDHNITKYVNVLKSLSEEIVINTDLWYRETVLNELIKCIIKLFDRNKYNLEVKQHCLDMWDNLYRRSLESIIPFTKIFDNMN